MGCSTSSSAVSEPQGARPSRGMLAEVGGYKLSKKVIGNGNYSTVHAANKGGVTYACKVVNKKKLSFRCTRAEKVAMEEGLENEIAALKVLNHPNIVRLYHVEESPDILYMVMEYMGGGELFDMIQASDNLTERDAASVCRQVGAALAYCHSKGVLHRDLKPENLLLQRPMTIEGIKVADFGFAKTLPKGDLTKSILGSPGYLAPEIRLGKAYSATVDVWSLGVIVYVLIFGYMPFPTENKVMLDSTTDIEKRFALDYTEPAWKEVSPQAREVLTGMLQPIAGKRWTAQQAISHMWVVSGGPAAGRALPSRNPSFRTPGLNRQAQGSFKHATTPKGGMLVGRDVISAWNDEYGGDSGAGGRVRGANFTGAVEQYVSTDDITISVGKV